VSTHLNIIDGCGEETFLALLMARPFAPATAVGTELDDGQVNDRQARFGSDPRLSFVRIGALNPAEQTSGIDGLVCMGILEHVVDWAPLFDRRRWLVKPGGTILTASRTRPARRWPSSSPPAGWPGGAA